MSARPLTTSLIQPLNGQRAGVAEATSRTGTSEFRRAFDVLGRCNRTPAFRRSSFKLRDYVGHTRRRQCQTLSSRGGNDWARTLLEHGFFKSIPEDATLRNEEVTTVVEAIAVGVRLYQENRRTVAVEYFDKALKMEPTNRERCILYYNLTCCHAYNGDQDSAEFCLRGGIRAGLNFEGCLTAAPTTELVELEANTQVRRRLQKFAQQCAR